MGRLQTGDRSWREVKGDATELMWRKDLPENYDEFQGRITELTATVPHRLVGILPVGTIGPSIPIPSKDPTRTK